jgi:xanthine dehydrogenase YagS FAD-binding subunit
VSDYARPSSLDEALKLLARDDAVPMGGGTDLAGQVDRNIRVPGLLVDLRDSGLGAIDKDGDGLRIGSAVTLAELAASPLVASYAAVASAAAAAASPLLRNVGTVGGNLCQHTRCWYYRGAEWHCWLGGGDTCYAQIGDHRKRGRRRTRELPLLDLYRRPTADDRSLVVLRQGELVTGVRLPAPPDRSAYERLGERAAFSFPLVSVAAARRGAETRLVAAGVANIPVELDPSDPLSGLKGSPQSAWKRRALATLVERAVGSAD